MIYSLFLENEKIKTYRVISQLLVFFNLLGFIFILAGKEEKIGANLWIMVSILATAIYLFFAFIKKVSKEILPDLWHRIILVYCAMAWIKEYWWIGLILIIIVILDIFACRKLIITFSDKKIIFPTVPKRNIGWNEMENVILKDNIITLDFKNNKVFQHYILNSGVEIDEEEFNNFCKQRIIANTNSRNS